MTASILICMLCFVVINSVILNLLRVWPEWSILLLGKPPSPLFCVYVLAGGGGGWGRGGVVRREIWGEWLGTIKQLQSTQTAQGSQTRHRSQPQNTSVNKQHPPQVQFQEPFDLQDGLRGVSEDPYQVVIFLFQQLLAHWDLEQNNYSMTDLALTVKVFNATRTRKWITTVQSFIIYFHRFTKESKQKRWKGEEGGVAESKSNF